MSMTDSSNLSRRNFLQATTSVSVASLLRIGAPALAAITQAACSARQEAADYLVFDADEAADFAAIAARIIPTTDTPGASEAGVIHFFDNAFAGAMSGDLDAARAGLAEFNAALAAAGYAGPFARLSDADQDAYLRRRESTNFFSLVRTMTIFGFFAMESYGGNKDHVGWDLIGFEGHHGGWTYPFGYYDAEYATENADGE
jgi:gluconate 2-dehydrogenase gamma chain